MHCLRALAGTADCAGWLATAEAALDAAARPDPAGGPPVRPCSLPLNALPHLFDSLCERLARDERLGALLHAALGARRVLLTDHCYVRHQPAPRHRRADQRPHSWHQDGALRFDFLAHRDSSTCPPDALLRMQVCWLALSPCGDGLAPSLAWYAPPLSTLMWPMQLQEASIEQAIARLNGNGPHTATLAAGDALVFDGGTLHHTHATADMDRARTSVELRWLPADAVPARLAGGRLLPMA